MITYPCLEITFKPNRFVYYLHLTCWQYKEAYSHLTISQQWFREYLGTETYKHEIIWLRNNHVVGAKPLIILPVLNHYYLRPIFLFVNWTLSNKFTKKCNCRFDQGHVSLSISGYKLTQLLEWNLFQFCLYFIEVRPVESNWFLHTIALIDILHFNELGPVLHWLFSRSTAPQRTANHRAISISFVHTITYMLAMLCS